MILKLLDALLFRLEQVGCELEELMDHPLGGGLLFAMIAIWGVGYACVYSTTVAFDHHETRETQIEAGNLDKMVQQYMLMQSPPRAPDSLEALTRGRAPVTTKVPQDHWGNDYIYRRMSDREWEIFSCGPDGEPDTEDDILAER